MIKISKDNNELLLTYTSELTDELTWLDYKLQQNGFIRLLPSGIFTFLPTDLIEIPSHKDETYASHTESRIFY